jgi:hypothetical protein
MQGEVDESISSTTRVRHIQGEVDESINSKTREKLLRSSRRIYEDQTSSDESRTDDSNDESPTNGINDVTTHAAASAVHGRDKASFPASSTAGIHTLQRSPRFRRIGSVIYGQSYEVRVVVEEEVSVPTRGHTKGKETISPELRMRNDSVSSSSI